MKTQPKHPVKVRTQLKHGSSVESMTSISGYAKYQVTTFQEAFQLEHEETTSHRSEEEITCRKKMENISTLKHGQELMKHEWCPWASGNMLSHMGYQLLGMKDMKDLMEAEIGPWSNSATALVDGG